MNKFLFIILILPAFYGCRNSDSQLNRIPVAKAGNKVLYYDEIPMHVKNWDSPADSISQIQGFINKWARRELMYKKAMENLPPELMNEIEVQLGETRLNLIAYEYQRMMMLQKMDTLISQEELERYYSENESSFMLPSNIVKALFIKLPVETPGLSRIRNLARTNNQVSLQQLESLCYQFAEKFDDFNEEWVDLDQLSLELPSEIQNQENFLRRTTFYETTNADSTFLYLLNIRDYKLRSSAAPFEYVKDDIKRIIWNNRRLEFIQSLENGIYNDALKENIFTILNK